MKKLQHLHILLKAYIDEPKVLDLRGLEDWMHQVVTHQNLEPVIGPNAVYVGDPGNEGPTGSVNIKTSHMAFHIWDEQGIIQADLYTCGDLDVEMFLEDFAIFNPSRISFMVLDRADGFKILAAEDFELVSYED